MLLAIRVETKSVEKIELVDIVHRDYDEHATQYDDTTERMAHRRFGAMYARSFERRPWLTLAVANGSLGALADVLAQSFERVQASSSSKEKEKKETNEVRPYEWQRTSRFFLFGVGMAPLLAEWNRFIEFRFPLRTAAAAGKVSLAALGKRVCVDQLAFAPFGLVCFVGAMGVMEGRDWSQIQQKFHEMYMPALLANWQLWPLVQTVNFRFMPLRFRVPFTGAIGIAWQVFLSILNASKRQELPPSSDVKAARQVSA